MKVWTIHGTLSWDLKCESKSEELEVSLSNLANVYRSTYKSTGKCLPVDL